MRLIIFSMVGLVLFLFTGFATLMVWAAVAAAPQAVLDASDLRDRVQELEAQVGALEAELVAARSAAPPPAPQAEPLPPPPPVVPPAPAAAEPRIEVSARLVGERRCEFKVETNLPLPVVVDAALELAGQKPDDIYIGYSEHVRIEHPEQVFVIDASAAREPLPAGEYEAVVTFFPQWGAEEGNPLAAEIDGEVRGAAAIRLPGGRAVADVQERTQAQRWVIENIVPGQRWDAAKASFALGESVEVPSGMNHHVKAYYFSKADRTILVNTLRGTIVTWRTGRPAK